MKSERQAKILQIIAERDIETQNQLIQALREVGCNSTQATVSRDMRELRLVKELLEDGRYHYVAPGSNSISGHKDRLRTIFRESVLSFHCAQNLVVIKTYPGLASAACAAIDSMDIPGLVGSLAGDDTMFLAMEDNAAADRFHQELQEIL
jgi:transcriptional regulator of arginine metabolism